MFRFGRLTILLSLALALGNSSPGSAPSGSHPHGTKARGLSFEQRVSAQAAIERVYYSHRIGVTRRFEEAVPRSLLERKVRTTLSQSVALETLWKSPISAESLRRELERIAEKTRFPDRLVEIYAALDFDPYVIQETFVRAELADRLTRSYVAGQSWATGPPLEVDGWSEEAVRRFDPALSREVASDLAALPQPGGAFESEPGTKSQPRYSGSEEAASSCALQDIWSGGEADAPPAPRSGHTAVWTGSEMIVWGGRDIVVDNLDTGGRYDPLTDSWRDLRRAGAPSARTEHTAVWTGQEMIIWGGSGVFDSSGGRYDPTSNTWTPTSLVNAPPRRLVHTAVWTGQEMIVWGGRVVGGGPVNSGGRYDPKSDTWSPTSPLNAPALTDHAAVWTGTEMIVWGGGSTSAGGVYRPDTDTWRPTSLLNAPPPRALPTAVWTGTEMIVWGGAYAGFSPGGGRYNPTTDVWRPTDSSTAPLNRYYHTAVWTGSRMIVWGGTDYSHQPPNSYVNTGAQYDPVADTWTPTSLAGAPAPRGMHSAVWTGDRMIVWGGGGLGSGGRYDPTTDTWTPTNAAPSSPSQRSGHTAVWTGSEMVVWGGTNDRSGGRYDPLLDSWKPTSLTDAPEPRLFHTAVWSGQHMVIWGGEGTSVLFNTGGRYDPASDTWLPTSTVNAPVARADHTAVWTGHTMIVWGGDVGDYLSTDTGGRYDPALDTWSPTSQVQAPSPRLYHTAVWTGKLMIIWGGGDADTYLNTGGRYDPALDAWSPTSLVQAPSPRLLHTAVWTGKIMIVWGGGNAGSLLATGGRYDPLSDSWTPTQLAGAPFARAEHTAVWTGREMIAWGGIYFSDFYVYSTSTGGRYDPVLDSWSATTMVGAPDPRNFHTAVWIGSVMIVRGGELNAGDIVYRARDPYTAWYGGVTAIPSPDSDQDGFSVCAGDCDDGQGAVYPGAPQICADGLNNDCSDPSWPSLAGTNEADDDGDGLSECGGDCDDANGTVWGPPAEVSGLEIGVPEPALLTWIAPAAGGTSSLRYDTLRSANPDDFVAGAVCVESDDPSDVSALDGDLPATGRVFFYLIRAENACPGLLGVGPLGTTPGGAPRQGRTCP